nr:immunoglobulin light chain junction region [Macaca mulatta]
CMQARVFPWSF